MIEPGGCNNPCLLCMCVAYDRPGGHEPSPGVGIVLAHSLRLWIGVVPVSPVLL